MTLTHTLGCCRGGGGRSGGRRWRSIWQVSSALVGVFCHVIRSLQTNATRSTPAIRALAHRTGARTRRRRLRIAQSAPGDVLSSGADACDLAATSHVPVKPARVALESDVNVTLRKPVVELYTVDALRVPESLAIRSVDTHAAVSHRKIDT